MMKKLGLESCYSKRIYLSYNTVLHSLQELWVSVVHHVCGSHEWAGGRCDHSPELDG